MISKLTLILAGTVAVFLMRPWSVYDLADRLYPVLAAVFPLEKNLLESARYRKRLKTYEAHYKRLDQADYLFFGDSHVQGFNIASYFADGSVVNYGISGDTAAGVLKRLPAARGQKKIKKGVLFMVGYNDLKYKSVETVIKDHRNLVTTAAKRFHLPMANIVLHSLFPVSQKRSYINANIIRINQAEKALCAELGCTFLDIYAHFTGSEGGLRKLYSKDGVHLNKEGYDVWATLLKQSLKI